MTRQFRFVNNHVSQPKDQMVTSPCCPPQAASDSQKLRAYTSEDVDDFKLVVRGGEFSIKSSIIRQHSSLVNKMIDADHDEKKFTLDLTDITDTTTLKDVVQWMQIAANNNDINPPALAWSNNFFFVSSENVTDCSIRLLAAVKIYVLADHLGIATLKTRALQWCQRYLHSTNNIATGIWPAMRYTILRTQHTDAELRSCMIQACLFNHSMQVLRQKEPNHRVFVLLRRKEPVLLAIFDRMRFSGASSWW